MDQFDATALPLKKAMSIIEPANRGFQQAANGLTQSMRQSLTDTLIEMYQADANLDRKDLTTALQTLIRQMIGSGDDVDAGTVAATAGTIVGTGDGVLVASAKRADGLFNENLLAETIRITCIADTTPSKASFIARGDLPMVDRLSQEWPLGSGCSIGVTAVDAGDSLLTNGDFDDWTQSNVPDYWIPSVATPGTTLIASTYEVQTLTVTGPPTAGTYIINWADPDSKARATVALAYNATAATLQAELRKFPGLELITVTSTGTTPLFTHTITFTGQAGNVGQITITNNTTGGTYTPATTTAGTLSFIGRGGSIVGTGAAQLTTLNQPLTNLKALTQYAFNIWMAADVVPAAGVITVDLVDGIGGAVVADQAGTNNSFTIDCTVGPMTTTFVAFKGVFRTPKIMPTTIYIRIRVSTAITSGRTIYFDHAALKEMTELYKGGPSAAIFSGKTPMRKSANDGQVEADYFVLTTTNDRAGELQEWFDRNFLMREKGLLLPSDTGGTETLLDTLIA